MVAAAVFPQSGGGGPEPVVRLEGSCGKHATFSRGAVVRLCRRCVGRVGDRRVHWLVSGGALLGYADVENPRANPRDRLGAAGDGAFTFRTRVRGRIGGPGSLVPGRDVNDFWYCEYAIVVSGCGA